MASHTIHYSGGRTEEVQLRNGYELAGANLVHVASRVNADAAAAQRALLFIKDFVREHYQILLFSVPTPGGRVDSVTWKLRGQQPPLTLFAMTAEVA